MVSAWQNRHQNTPWYCNYCYTWPEDLVVLRMHRSQRKDQDAGTALGLLLLEAAMLHKRNSK